MQNINEMESRMSESGSIVVDLMGIKGGAIGVPYNSERDRFNMPHCAETRVSESLNANRIVVDGKNIAIATQYPFDYQVEAQLQMLLDNHTPVLIVLASATDIQNHEMPQYFSGSATYGEIQTKSKFVDYIDLGNDIESKVFNLSITGPRGSIDIPVLHVSNWPDHRTVSPETTIKLVELIETKVEQSRATFASNGNAHIDNVEKMLPVMHCKAGVGRTGQTLAAMVMKKSPELTLESITKDLRASRNDRMIQSPYQMKTLVKLENMQDKPVQQVTEAKAKSGRSFFSKLFGS